MKKIIFVDDDPNVLSGIRRMMRSNKDEWRMHFVNSGVKVLALLATDDTFDAIVSDMRMPGMNGPDLLRAVKQDYPQTIRLAFSGQTEQEMALDVTTTAHQYISKPCDSLEVTQVINRICKLRQILANDEPQRLASGLGNLPSLPDLYLKIVDILNSPEGSLRDVGETIGKDVAMTAKILQLVNSAFFNLPQHVSTPVEAVTLLGSDVIKGLVLSAKVFSSFEQSNVSAVDIPQLSQQGMDTAALARKIARAETKDRQMQDYAFMAGMLHQVGQLVLAVNLPQDYAQVITALGQSRREIWECEQDVFGHSHMAVGAYLLGLWGLADPIVEAVAYYRYPRQVEGHQFSALTAVHAASALLLAEQHPDEQVDYFDREYISELGITDRIEEWCHLLRDMRANTEAE